jgi:hypothetical protein
MRFQGKLYKDGKFWLVEVPVFAAMTQGRTRKEALAMIADWFVTTIDRPGFSVAVHEGKQDTFASERQSGCLATFGRPEPVRRVSHDPRRNP